MIHELKIEPQHFKRVVTGEKQFEIRFNDCGFQKDDVIVLQEYKTLSNTFTGAMMPVVILYVTNYMQKENYVVFGFKIDHEYCRSIIRNEMSMEDKKRLKFL